MKYYKLYKQYEGIVGRTYPYDNTVFDENAAKAMQAKDPDLKLHETTKPPNGQAWTITV